MSLRSWEKQKEVKPYDVATLWVAATGQQRFQNWILLPTARTRRIDNVVDWSLARTHEALLDAALPNTATPLTLTNLTIPVVL
jgi:hypothetical protein